MLYYFSFFVYQMINQNVAQLQSMLSCLQFTLCNVIILKKHKSTLIMAALHVFGRLRGRITQRGVTLVKVRVLLINLLSWVDFSCDSFQAMIALTWIYYSCSSVINLTAICHQRTKQREFIQLPGSYGHVNKYLSVKSLHIVCMPSNLCVCTGIWIYMAIWLHNTADNKMHRIPVQTMVFPWI